MFSSGIVPPTIVREYSRTDTELVGNEAYDLGQCCVILCEQASGMTRQPSRAAKFPSTNINPEQSLGRVAYSSSRSGGLRRFLHGAMPAKHGLQVQFQEH